MFNRDPGPDEEACDTADYNVYLPLDGGNLPTPTTLGWSDGEAKDTVDVCREDGDTWIWILTGNLKGGASGGGKNKNK